MALAQENHGVSTMWFNPNALIKIESAPPANFANSANLKAVEDERYPKLAELAELATPPCIEKPESPPDFLVDDRHYCHECKNIKNGYCIKLEFRPVDDLPRRCSEFDAAAVPNKRHWAASAQIVCYDCQHFKSINPHGRGAGLCGKGRQGSGGSGLFWHSDVHFCELFEQKPCI